MFNLIALLIGLVIIFAVLVMGINVIKRRRLEIKLDEYHQLLEKARIQRLAYVTALNNAEKVNFLLEATENEATSLKTRLIEQKAELHNMLVELRKTRFSTITSSLDQKILDQKNFDFYHAWKATNRLKMPFNQKYAEIKLLRDQHTRVSKLAEGQSEQWFSLRRVTMEMYGELKSETNVPNPREVLLMDAAP